MRQAPRSPAPAIRPVPVSRMEANSRPGGTFRSACSGGGGVSSAMPWLRASRRARSVSASALVRYARRPALPLPLANRIRSSARPKNRARPGRTVSIAWIWLSGKRPEVRRIRPLSTSSTPPSSLHLVTSQEINPSAKTTISTPMWARSPPSDPRWPPPPAAGINRTKTMAITPRPVLTSGERGCSRCHSPPKPAATCGSGAGSPPAGGAAGAAGSLTAPSRATRPGRSAGRAGERPPKRAAPGCARRWRPRRCASARWPSRTPARRARR